MKWYELSAKILLVLFISSALIACGGGGSGGGDGDSTNTDCVLGGTNTLDNCTID